MITEVSCGFAFWVVKSWRSYRWRREMKQKSNLEEGWISKSNRRGCSQQYSDFITSMIYPAINRTRDCTRWNSEQWKVIEWRIKHLTKTSQKSFRINILNEPKKCFFTIRAGETNRKSITSGPTKWVMVYNNYFGQTPRSARMDIVLRSLIKSVWLRHFVVRTFSASSSSRFTLIAKKKIVYFKFA